MNTAPPTHQDVSLDVVAAAVAIRLGFVRPDSLIRDGHLMLDAEQAKALFAPLPTIGQIVTPVASRPAAAIAAVEGGDLSLVNEGDHLRITAGVLGRPTILPVASNVVAVRVS